MPTSGSKQSEEVAQQQGSQTTDFHGIAIEPGNPEDLFEPLQVLGKGTFGTVIKARNTKTNDIVAIKQILLGKDDEIEVVRKEVKILNECVHPNIVQYCGTYISLNTLWIVMEYCAGGSVDAIFRVLKRPLPENLIAYVCREVLNGLVYLHGIHKIHRDIKGGNILLGQRGEVKLADFGVSTELVHTMSRRNSFIGTLYWMAPEAIQEKEYDERADLWSLGITTIEMAESAPPHMHMHYGRALLAIPRDPPPTLQAKDKWSPMMQKFVARLLTKDQLQRPTAQQMLKDPFVSPERIGTADELAVIIEDCQARLATMSTARRLGEESSASSSNATFVEVTGSGGDDAGAANSSNGNGGEQQPRQLQAERKQQDKHDRKIAVEHPNRRDGDPLAGAANSTSAGAGGVLLPSWALDGTLPHLPVLSTDDISLDELGGGGDATTSIAPLGKIPSVLALLADADPAAGGERLPDQGADPSSSSASSSFFLNQTTRSLLGMYYYNKDLVYRRGLTAEEADKARALATRYGSALKTILRV